jgi:imidazolonepropionase-like amidohydrolase
MIDMFKPVACILLGSLFLHGQQRPVAFVDVTVVPMDRERLLPHQTVITEGDRITALGPVQTTQPPQGAQRIDGRGRFLMPGLADMHVHLNIGGRANGLLKNGDYATLFIANGVTTVRNMWGSPDILALRKTIDQGSVIGPRIYTTGPLTDGKPPIRPLSRVVETVAQAVDAVTSDKHEGYDAVKVYNHLSPETYAAIVSTARTLGLPVYGHVPDRVGIEGVLAARQDSIEHVEGYLDALDRDDSPGAISALVSATRMAGAWNCVTLAFFQGAVPGDEAARLLAKPSMRFVPPALTTLWKDNPQLASLTPYQFGRLRLYDEKRNKFVRALHEGGAKILLGTDTPNQFVVPGFAIHEELRNLISAGFTPYEAIRAGTSDAAEFLKSQNQWGTVAAGLQADLILVEANPLQDVSNVNRRIGVMVRGQWMTELELKNRLEQLAASYSPGH